LNEPELSWSYWLWQRLFISICARYGLRKQNAPDQVRGDGFIPGVTDLFQIQEASQLLRTGRMA